MQSTNFVSSNGEGRNPFYEGQFDGETPEQAAYRLHWSRATREADRAKAHQIEVDRDIKAANLQLLVEKVLAAVPCIDDVADCAELRELEELARGLKQ